MPSNTSTYTLRLAIEYVLHNLTNSGFLSDDNPYSKKALAFHLMDARASTIRDYIRAEETIPEEMKQYLNCVKMHAADRNECPGQPPSGCIWLKSEKPLPKFIKMYSVSNTLGTKQFDPLDWGRYKDVSESRIKSQARGDYYTLKNTSKGVFLYIHTQTPEQEMLKNVTVSGIFENPIEAALSDECVENKESILCNPMDVDFYTCAEMRDSIFDKVWNRLTQLRSRTIVDENNDDSVDDRIPR